MEKGQESQNFDCDVKPETEVERMERHTDQGEMERRTDWQWRGDPGHCQGLGRRKVRERHGFHGGSARMVQAPCHGDCC